MPSDAYAAAKLEQLRDVTVTRIYGRPLDDADPMGLSERTAERVRIPLQWCLCVQDSPESPCPCRPLIIWVGRSDIVAHGKTEHKDHDGNVVYFFDLTNDAELLLERIQPISTRAAKKMATMAPKSVDKLLAVSTTLASLPFDGPKTIAFDPNDWEMYWIVLEGIADTLAEWGKEIDLKQWTQDYLHGRQH